MAKKKNIPDIRFKGFSDEWEEYSLGELGSVVMNKRIFKNQTLEDGDIPFYKIGTFGGLPNAFISRDLFEEYKSKYPYPEKGDILISASGSIGRIVEYLGKDEYFQDSNIVWLQHDNRIQNSFLKYFYNVVKWSGLEGSTIKRLYNKNILDTSISLPQPKEQTQIGNYFKNLDQLITQHQQKYDKLLSIKKAMLKKMFPQNGANVPEIRFKGFTDEWVEKKLENITNAIFDGTHQTPTYTDFGIPFFSVENLISNKSNKFISYTDYLETTKINKPEKNDVLITRIGNIGFSKVVDWDYPFSIYVTLAVIKQSEQFNSYFLNFNIQSSQYQNELLTNSLLSAVPCKINMDNLRKTKITISTDIQEQTKIGNYFTHLDNLITLNNQKLEKLKNIKKAFLDKMFV